MQVEPARLLCTATRCVHDRHTYIYWSAPCPSACPNLALAHTQAALVVADKSQSLQITGNGDVLEPHDGIIAIGRCV